MGSYYTAVISAGCSGALPRPNYCIACTCFSFFYFFVLVCCANCSCIVP